MSLPSQPHDTLFRAIVSKPPLAAALLADYLPDSLAALLDPESPVDHVEGTFIDDEGARSQCDALFRARLRSGEPFHIYALIEHKSRVDEATPLQLLGYMVNIWRRDLAEGTDGLRPIIPMVFYHGRQEWRVPLSVAAMIDAPEILKPYVRDFAYILHDLGRIAPERLSSDPEVYSALITLVVATTTDMRDEDLDLISAALVADGVVERIILNYAGAVSDLPKAAMEASLKRMQPERWEMLMGTLAETWIEEARTEARTEGLAEGLAEGRAEGLAEGLAEGRAEGLAEGLAEGRAHVVLLQMQRRFGNVPEDVRRRIRDASVPELDAWSVAVLDAPTIDDAMTSACGQ